MTGFGEDLKRERESRGMTLEGLAAETRVKLHHLLALEAGEYDALPGGLFRRGILRAYLTAAGLEEQTWLRRFDSSFEEFERSRAGALPTKEESWVTFAENVKRNRKSVSHSNSARWIGVLLLFLAVIAAAWAVWQFVLRGRLGA